MDDDDADDAYRYCMLRRSGVRACGCMPNAAGLSLGVSAPYSKITIHRWLARRKSFKAPPPYCNTVKTLRLLDP